MESTLQQRSTLEWLEVLNTAGVPCGPENSVAEVVKDPQVAARQMIVSISDPVIGNLQVAGNPIKLSGVPERTDHKAPPLLDGDRDAILSFLNAQKSEKP
jgi:CoA:oxalate CoA-transferase